MILGTAGHDETSKGKHIVEKRNVVNGQCDVGVVKYAVEGVEYAVGAVEYAVGAVEYAVEAAGFHCLLSQTA